MPIQKDLKKIVRARMEKTGEAYTAARQHIVGKKPQIDYAELAGMSDAAVKKATGRDWASWVKTLDAVQASDKPHREIAEYVRSLGTPDWWSQGVTVGYERIRGLREKGQRRGGGYEANKSRTFTVPAAKLFETMASATKRKKWMPIAMKVRTSTPHKTMRVSFEDGTLAQFYFLDKGAKSTVAVQHQKLADKDTANRMKEWWTERFDALAELLT
jgi:hypothetical protein